MINDLTYKTGSAAQMDYFYKAHNFKSSQTFIHTYILIIFYKYIYPQNVTPALNQAKL